TGRDPLRRQTCRDSRRREVRHRPPNRGKVSRSTENPLKRSTPEAQDVGSRTTPKPLKPGGKTVSRGGAGAQWTCKTPRPTRHLSLRVVEHARPATRRTGLPALLTGRATTTKESAMDIRVSGHQVDVGDAFRTHVETRLEQLAE